MAGSQRHFTAVAFATSRFEFAQIAKAQSIEGPRHGERRLPAFVGEHQGIAQLDGYGLRRALLPLATRIADLDDAPPREARPFHVDREAARHRPGESRVFDPERDGLRGEETGIEVERGGE